MSRFARIDESVYRRRKELADRNRGQGYHETLILYELIVMHSWANGLCDKTLPELCGIYNLEYHNSTRRLKILREKSWVENTPDYIKPLLLHRPEKKEKSSVNSTPRNENKGVNSTPENDANGVNSTPDECKFYTENDANGVNSTPENGANSGEISDSGDAMIFKDLKSNFMTTAAGAEAAAAAVKTNGHKSVFSIEECLRYGSICVKRGDPIKSVEALASHALKTGEMDAFIQATLYPEEPGAKEINFAALSIDGGELTEKERGETLKLLADVKAMGDDLNEFEHYYTPPDWAYLMKELNKIHK